MTDSIETKNNEGLTARRLRRRLLNTDERRIVNVGDVMRLYTCSPMGDFAASLNNKNVVWIVQNHVSIADGFELGICTESGVKFLVMECQSHVEYRASGRPLKDNLMKDSKTQAAGQKLATEC